MLGTEGTTHTVSCTKRLECYKHLFQLKSRVFYVYMHAFVCDEECLTANRDHQIERSNGTKYFGCVLHKLGLHM